MTMEYSLAEVHDMVNELGVRELNESVKKTAVILFCMGMSIGDSEKLADFTGYTIDEIAEREERLLELGYLTKDGEFTFEWLEEGQINHTLSFVMDVLAIDGYFTLTTKDGKRAYVRNPDMVDPFINSLGIE